MAKLVFNEETEAAVAESLSRLAREAKDQGLSVDYRVITGDESVSITFLAQRKAPQF